MEKINVLIALGGLLSVGSIGCMENYVNQAVTRAKITCNMDESGKILVNECGEIVNKSLNEQNCPTPLKENVLESVANANTPQRMVLDILKARGDRNNNDHDLNSAVSNNEFLYDDNSFDASGLNENIINRENNNVFNQHDFDCNVIDNNPINLSDISKPVVKKTTPGKAPRKNKTREIGKNEQTYNDAEKAVKKLLAKHLSAFKSNKSLSSEEKLEIVKVFRNQINKANCISKLILTKNEEDIAKNRLKNNNDARNQRAINRKNK